jgi:hypothetical protein
MLEEADREAEMYGVEEAEMFEGKKRQFIHTFLYI